MISKTTGIGGSIPGGRAALDLPRQERPVDYEQTVDDLESVSRRVVTACGLEWEPSCLEFHQTRRPVRTASVTQVRQPVYRESLARWRNYDQTLASLFAALTISVPGTQGDRRPGLIESN